MYRKRKRGASIKVGLVSAQKLGDFYIIFSRPHFEFRFFFVVVVDGVNFKPHFHITRSRVQLSF